MLGVVMHALNSSVWEAETKGSVSARPTWSPEFQGSVVRETLSLKKRREEGSKKEKSKTPILKLMRLEK